MFPTETGEVEGICLDRQNAVGLRSIVLIARLSRFPGCLRQELSDVLDRALDAGTQVHFRTPLLPKWLLLVSCQFLE